MSYSNLSAEFCIKEINKLAASHQMGESLEDVKPRVLSVIKSYHLSLGDERGHQVDRWNSFYNLLELNKTADPKWASVILFARSKVRVRKRTAKLLKK